MYIAASRQGRVNRCKFRGVYIGRDRCNIIPFFTSTIMSRNTIAEKLLLLKLRTTEDPEAFAKLYDIYAKRIYSFVFFKVSNREEAEDITSEVFLKAWRYINEKKSIESFSGLLYKLARNCIIDLYRSKATHKEVFSVNDENE